MTISMIIGSEQQISTQINLQIANKILDVLERYRLRHRDGTSNRNEEGRKRFLPIVMRKVERFQPIQMVLPAFPFKSPNNDSKVLGTIPDKGEEIALAHLDGLCKSIEDIYNPGAQVTIASDGIAYNDLLGVSDRDVWVYGQTLRKIAQSSNLNHIHFVPLRDLFGLNIPEPVSEESYIAQAQEIRDKINEIYTPTGFDARQEISKNEDAAATYRGYIKFLSKDLANTKKYETKISKSAIKKRNEMVARKMMCRGKAFAAAVQANLKDYVRLSIHPSSGSTKLSISLFPHTGHSMTPWHATTVCGLNGSVTTAHLDSLKTSANHELVLKDGAPWYYREKSDLYNWSDAGVSFEPLYPKGLLITPTSGFDIQSFSYVDATKLRCLAEQNSPVVLRGFTRMEIQVLISEVTEAGLSSERDGQGPQFSRLQILTSGMSKNGLYAISSFSSSYQLFENLSVPLGVKLVSNRSFRTLAGPFERTTLITPHLNLDMPYLRYQTTQHSNGAPNISNGNLSAMGVIDTLVYDRRVCYDHVWKDCDLVINDPSSATHICNNTLLS